MGVRGACEVGAGWAPGVAPAVTMGVPTLCVPMVGGAGVAFVEATGMPGMVGLVVTGWVESDDAESDRTRFSPVRGSSVEVVVGSGVVGSAGARLSLRVPVVFTVELLFVAALGLSLGILCLPPALSFRVTLRSLGDAVSAVSGSVCWHIVE